MNGAWDVAVTNVQSEAEVQTLDEAMNTMMNQLD